MGVDMNTAKVFWSGRSQAVRLPKAFRFLITHFPQPLPLWYDP